MGSAASHISQGVIARVGHAAVEPASRPSHIIAVASSTGTGSDAMHLSQAAAGLASILPVGQLEIPVMSLRHRPSPYSAIEASLVDPVASAIALTRVPAVMHRGAPIELEFTIDRFVPEAHQAPASESVACCIVTHALISVVIATHQSCDSSSYSVPVSVRSSGSGWIARALIHPATWVEAASVTVVSLTLAGHPLLPDCLPATLRVFSHAAAPAGAVHEAAQDGNVPALKSALDAGGSTEEVDWVSPLSATRVSCFPPPHSLP